MKPFLPLAKLAFSLAAVVLCGGVGQTALAAQPVSAVSAAVPYYSGENALTGLYAYHLPPLSQAFQVQADLLVQATQRHCNALPSQGEDHAAMRAAWGMLHTQWQQTMSAWEALSTPAVGPVLTRRSQRQIDFWPTRPELITKALGKAPQTLTDMERVGTLAKGLPGFEALLAAHQPMDPVLGSASSVRGHRPGEKTRERPSANPAMSTATCHYLTLVAQGVQLEARELRRDLAAWAARDWAEQSEADVAETRAALAEWLNQWLGGVERLRWMHIEKPIRALQTAGNSVKENPHPYARLGREANLAGWRAQWASLKAQGQLTVAQRRSAPVPGHALVPIEGLLLGKGHMALAHQWSQALHAVTDRLDVLPATAPVRATDHHQLLALADALKAVAMLYQTEVATALDIPLGFSDADGD